MNILHPSPPPPTYRQTDSIPPLLLLCMNILHPSPPPPPTDRKTDSIPPLLHLPTDRPNHRPIDRRSAAGAAYVNGCNQRLTDADQVMSIDSRHGGRPSRPIIDTVT